jgi:hypothetical protein
MALHKENTMTIAIAVIFASIYVASLLKVAAKPTPKPTPRTPTAKVWQSTNVLRKDVN